MIFLYSFNKLGEIYYRNTDLWEICLFESEILNLGLQFFSQNIILIFSSDFWGKMCPLNFLDRFSKNALQKLDKLTLLLQCIIKAFTFFQWWPQLLQI